MKISVQYISLPPTYTSNSQTNTHAKINFEAHTDWRLAFLKAANKIKEWKKDRSKHSQEFTVLNTDFVYLHNRNHIPGLFTHLSDEMSISRCVQRWKILTRTLNKRPLSYKSPPYTGSHTSQQTLCHSQADAQVFGHAMWTHVYKQWNTRVSTELC